MSGTRGAVAVLAVVAVACSSGGSRTHTIVVSPDLPVEEPAADASVAPQDAADSSVIPRGCTSAADCASGLICCAFVDMTTNCQLGPCPSEGFGISPIQLCTTSAECFMPGSTCGAPATAVSVPIRFCSTRCTPLTCANLPAGSCGPISDECGAVIQCGTCTPPAFCGGGGASLCGRGAPVACYHDLCVPLTCADVDCGLNGNGCGGLIDCGSCPRPSTCSSEGQCEWPADAGPCAPATCEGLAYDCGVLSDGCGGHLECGTCPVSQFCGGGGAHRCGGACDTPDGGDPCEVTCSSDDGGSCTGQSCQGSGSTCGEASNGCGGLIDCGPCGSDAGTSDAPAGG